MHKILLCLLSIFVLVACKAEPTKPQAQNDFSEEMSIILNMYKSGDTDAQKDVKKKEAVEARTAFFTRMVNKAAFDGWVCKVEDVRKPAGTKLDELQLIAKCGTFNLYNFVYTGGTELSPQQILKSNPIYNTLMSLKKGDVVKLSGEFLVKDGKIFETSLTEHGGITEPEMAVVFKAVEAVK